MHIVIHSVMSVPFSKWAFFAASSTITPGGGVGAGRTGLMVRASDSGSGDPGSILGRVGVLFP